MITAILEKLEITDYFTNYNDLVFINHDSEEVVDKFIYLMEAVFSGKEHKIQKVENGYHEFLSVYTVIVNF